MIRIAACLLFAIAALQADPIKVVPQPNNPDTFQDVQTTGVVRPAAFYDLVGTPWSTTTNPLGFECACLLAAQGNENPFIQTLNNFGGGWSFTFAPTVNIADNSFLVHTYEAEAPPPPFSNSDAFTAAGDINTFVNNCANNNNCVGSEFYLTYSATGDDPNKNVHWIQLLYDNVGNKPMYSVDTLDPASPYYDSAGTATAGGFFDLPGTNHAGSPHFFDALLLLVSGPTNPGEVTIYGGVDWGWSNQQVPEPSSVVLCGLALVALFWGRMSRLVLALAAPLSAQTMIVSIDGMRPDYLLKADQYGLKIPHLRRILHDGAHASGVRAVLPTVTYANHTTILTGVWPSKHGIYSNLTFDPFDRNLAGWYWYSEAIQSPTLWEAAAKAGLTVGSVSWPVSVGAPGVRYLIPEYWRAPKSSGEDLKLLRALSSPGLMAEIEKKAGPYVNDLDEAEAGDRQRTRFAAAIIRDKHAQFVTVHLAALDHLQHGFGPFSKEAFATLEESDAEVGELEDAAGKGYTICIVSDHGFARTEHTLNLRAPFVDAGLITVNDKHHVTDWKAFPKPDGGSAAILLKDPTARDAVEQLLKRLASDPANGIAAILGPKEIAGFGGDPHAAFWVDMKTNFSVVADDGPQVKERKVAGTHGFAPSHPEMLASFFIAGPGIRSGADLGEIDMRAIAPTLAHSLRVPFPSADLKSLDIFTK